MIDMASNVAKRFDIEKKGHRIAILEFSSKAILSKWLRYPFDQIKVISTESFVFCREEKDFSSEHCRYSLKNIVFCKYSSFA